MGNHEHLELGDLLGACAEPRKELWINVGYESFPCEGKVPPTESGSLLIPRVAHLELHPRQRRLRSNGHWSAKNAVWAGTQEWFGPDRCEMGVPAVLPVLDRPKASTQPTRPNIPLSRKFSRLYNLAAWADANLPASRAAVMAALALSSKRSLAGRRSHIWM